MNAIKAFQAFKAYDPNSNTDSNVAAGTGFDAGDDTDADADADADSDAPIWPPGFDDTGIDSTGFDPTELMDAFSRKFGDAVGQRVGGGEGGVDVEKLAADVLEREKENR